MCSGLRRRSLCLSIDLYCFCRTFCWSLCEFKWTEKDTWLFVLRSCVFPLRLLKQKITDWWLKEENFIFSQFWRLEVQKKGVGRVGFWWGLSSQLADSRRLAVSLHGLLSNVSFSYNHSSPVGLECVLWPRFPSVTSLKTPSPNTVTMRVRTSTYGFWRIQFHS